jgi:hypothetical protein
VDFNEYYKTVHDPLAKEWEGKPHGWIQWKGTDVCVDIRCVCGSTAHIDASFFYHWACLECGRKYALSAYVAMIELTPEQAKFVDDGGACAFVTDPEQLTRS